ncbi:MAG: hypothetical protein ACKO3W_14190, partial [bacterium]
LPLAERIERTWLDLRAQGCASWQEHIDINEAMLAACLLPEVVLEVMPMDLTSARGSTGASAIAVGAAPGSVTTFPTASSVRETLETP